MAQSVRAVKINVRAVLFAFHEYANVCEGRDMCAFWLTLSHSSAVYAV